MQKSFMEEDTSVNTRHIQRQTDGLSRPAGANQELPVFVIRQFTNRRSCEGATELERALIADYQGCSVSVQYMRPSGMQAALYVDVTPGGIVESYGAQSVVDFSALEATRV
jgi:hypothetical protein